MNGPAWFAFAVSAIVAASLASWSLLVTLGFLPNSKTYRDAYTDGMYVVVAFFLTGLAAILVGTYE